MATKKTESKIEIPAMDFRMATLHVVGDSPLIVHAWSEKAKRMICLLYTSPSPRDI